MKADVLVDSDASSNLPQALQPLIVDGRIPMRRVWGMLALRSALSFGLLVALAAILAASGRSGAVSASAAWWLWFVTAANIACIVLMARFGRLEGLRLRDIYFASGSTWRGDLVWALVALVGTAVFAMLPGTLVAGALWADPNHPNVMLFQALPLLAVYPLFLVMPVTQALAELPTYWGYVAPRLRAAGTNRWIVVGIVGAVLSVQHMFFAFQLDWRYDLWLAVKFLPFALWTGFIVDRRPTTLPYLMGLHLALDASLPLLLLMASTGVRLG
jgi:hypothetical protein